jgi:mRNA interferase RelE/StbE
MRVKLSKSAVKFLEQLEAGNANRVREKIAALKNSLEQRQALPFDELDIKKLKGDWKGFFRIRTGDIRIIFRVEAQQSEILTHDIRFRQSAYD